MEVLSYPLSLLPGRYDSPQDWLGALGRAELLTEVGPDQLAQIAARAPYGFLLETLPQLLAKEEFIFRGAVFLALFVAWIVAARVSSRLSEALKALPDISLLVLARKMLETLGKSARLAYPLAAAIGAASFTFFHFDAWGIEPYYMAFHVAGALVLTRVAYVTRGLLAPFLAHYSFIVLTLVPPILALHYALPNASRFTDIALSCLALAVSFYFYGSHRAARRAKR